MKKLNILYPLIAIAILLTSCLESGLEELPAYDEAEILDFKFESRGWDAEANTLDITRVSATVEIDSASATIHCEVREKGDVTIDNLVGIADISIAAKIRPLENAPTLGVPGDFTQGNIQYEVIAADDVTKRIWTITVEPK